MSGFDIRQGDVLDRLREMPDESVSCCVTSPPYYGLRAYLPGVVQVDPRLTQADRLLVIAELERLGILPIVHMRNLPSLRALQEKCEP